MTRKSSGEAFAQIKAESRNPIGDPWWGGTGIPASSQRRYQLTAQSGTPAGQQEWVEVEPKGGSAEPFQQIGSREGSLR